MRKKSYDHLRSGRIKDLGAVQIVALLVMEIDFKAGNVGIDRNLNAVKIDGGLCFATNKKKYKEKKMDITAADLQALPIFSAYSNYQPCNWLDYIQCYPTTGPAINSRSRLSRFPANTPSFRREINETILRILLLPDQLIYTFTQSYIPEYTIAKQLADVLIKRKMQLEKAANQEPSFLEYKSSANTKKNILNYIDYLKSFKTMGKSLLLTAIKQQWNFDVEEHIIKAPNYQRVSSIKPTYKNT